MKIKWLSFVLIVMFFGCNSSKKKVNQDLTASINKGAEIYQNFCISCHMTNGEGVKKIFPPLNNSDYLKNIEASIRATKYGLKGPIKVNGKEYDGLMLPLGLDDEEVANVMNYVNNSWDNKNDALITTEQVSKIQPK